MYGGTGLATFTRQSGGMFHGMAWILVGFLRAFAEAVYRTRRASEKREEFTLPCTVVLRPDGDEPSASAAPREHKGGSMMLFVAEH